MLLAHLCYITNHSYLLPHAPLWPFCLFTIAPGFLSEFDLPRHILTICTGTSRTVLRHCPDSFVFDLQEPGQPDLPTLLVLPPPSSTPSPSSMVPTTNIAAHHTRFQQHALGLMT